MGPPQQTNKQTKTKQSNKQQQQQRKNALEPNASINFAGVETEKTRRVIRKQQLEGNRVFVFICANARRVKQTNKQTNRRTLSLVHLTLVIERCLSGKFMSQSNTRTCQPLPTPPQ